MRTRLVVGNWKMNGSLVSNRALLNSLPAKAPAGVSRVVCVPFPYLAQAAELLADSNVEIGAQNVSEYPQGAYTGEVSSGMVAEFGSRYVIVGHSERRSLFGEADEVVARKAAAVLCAGMTPIVCVGETLEERESERVESVLRRQLDALDPVVDASALAGIVIAYEPVWAIGTGRAASPAQVQEVLSFIRNWLAAHGRQAGDVKILYGGSVKPDGAAELFGLPDCDGGLIGGASLVAAEFIAICDAAGNHSQRA